MKYPYEILLDKAPFSSELNYQMWDVDSADDPEMIWWKEKSFIQVIAEVQEIADKYSIGSGWSHAEEIESGTEMSKANAKKELKELKAVIRHMKRVYKKEVK